MDFLGKMYDLSKQRADLLDEDTTGTTMGGNPMIRPFRRVLKDMAVIAEVKYATPARGNLGIKTSPGEIAAGYAAKGAAAVSCITEPAYFAGSMEYISMIRQSCELPILMKGFIVDERQIILGRQCGADAFLLITEMLCPEELERLYAFGRHTGMDCLVEVHSLKGLDKALAINADCIGVNARDLATLEVDPSRHEEIIPHIPEHVTKVAESGITTEKRRIELGSKGYDAALIGTVLMTGFGEGGPLCG
ncbi:MAG: indole-3-glycerol-phosphate synthase [Thermodesulfobacteriota bacterium]|nr:indole-3-glycerol-phosphate synthase [Thermodesulfobacteriota bacterium]